MAAPRSSPAGSAAANAVLRDLVADVNGTLRTMIKITSDNELPGLQLLRSTICTLDAFVEMNNVRPQTRAASEARAAREPTPRNPWSELESAERIIVMMHDKPTARVSARYEDFKNDLGELHLEFEEVPPWGTSDEVDRQRKMLMRISSPDRRWPLVFYTRAGEDYIRFAGSHATLMEACAGEDDA